MRLSRFAVAAGLAAVTAIVAARSAEACGGTFCDSGPRFMSVDQTGETIVFVMEPGKVEAHIQIQYKGEAAKFSWVLPVQALPEIEVGSQAFFTRLLGSTVPTYGYTTQRDFCGTTAGTSTGSTGTGGGFSDASAGTPVDAGVTIVSQKEVGAFDVTVLSGRTTADVLAWLADNQYQTPPNAAALFDAYVAKSYYFIAVKLAGGTGIDEIHPLVVRYAGSEPCVPLKLTAVAAVEDMGVRTFFLGNQRVVPKNFKHVVPNPVKLDWMQLGANYKDLVGRAVDSPIANGKAFVTEYAGPTAIVGTTRLAPTQWDAGAFPAIAPVDVVTRLQQQGLMACNAFNHTCSYAHPLLLPILRQYLPAPASIKPGADAGGVTTIVDPTIVEGYFYGCLSCYQNLIDATKWDGAAFSAALAQRIIDPARHADALLTAWPYLTRLFTTISPVEMTEDPEFRVQDGLPTVRIAGTGTRRITCANASAMTLPDGRQVALTPSSTWPAFSDQMPWAERIEEYTDTGETLVLVDNTQKINSQLAAWNDSQGWYEGDAGRDGGSAGAGAGGSIVGSTTVGPSTGPGSTSTTTGSAGGEGGAGGAGGAPNGAEVTTPTSGCSCRTERSNASFGGPGALLALFAVLARRRRRGGTPS